MTQIVVNDNAYSDDGSTSRDMRLGGFRQWLLPMIADQMIEVRDAPEKSAAAAQAAKNAQYLAEEARAASAGFREEALGARDLARQASDSARGSSESASQSAMAADAASATAIQAAVQATAVGPGWTPVIALQQDGMRVVGRVADFAGGAGNKPGCVGMYLGSAGYVADMAQAQDLRGPRGERSNGEAIHSMSSAPAGIVSAPAGEQHGDHLILAGYGLYTWDAQSTIAADRETVIEAPGGGAGRWLLRLPAWEFVWAQLAPVFEQLRREMRRPSLLSTVALLDFPGIASAGTAELTVALPDAAVGMPAVVAAPAALAAGLTAMATVTSPGHVTVSLKNTTAAVIDPAAMAYTICVLPLQGD